MSWRGNKIVWTTQSLYSSTGMEGEGRGQEMKLRRTWVMVKSFVRLLTILNKKSTWYDIFREMLWIAVWKSETIAAREQQGCQLSYNCMYTRSEMTVAMTKMTEAEELRVLKFLPYFKSWNGKNYWWVKWRKEKNHRWVLVWGLGMRMVKSFTKVKTLGKELFSWQKSTVLCWIW